MDFINNAGERFIVPLAGFLNGNRYLKAVKSGLTIISPVFFAGGLFLILAFPAVQKIDFSGWGTAGNFFELWKLFAAANLPDLLLPVNITIGVCSLWIAIAIACQLAKYYKIPQLLCGIIAGAVLILYVAPENVVLVTKTSAQAFMRDMPLAFVPGGLAGAQGVLPAIFIGIITAEVMRCLDKIAASLKLPGTVPPAVLPAILAVLSVFAAFFVLFMLNEATAAFFDLSLPGCIWIVSRPLLEIAGSLPFIVAVVLLAQWTWFLGMHGCNTASHIIQPFTMAFILLNAEAVMNGQLAAYPFTDPFWTSAVILGGNGATLGLVIAARLFARSGHLRRSSGRALGSVVFNVNELVAFGFPVIQTRKFLWPYLIVPVINAVIMYLAISAGIVRAAFCPVPWVLPGPLAAFFSTLDLRALLLVCSLIVLDMILYLPFLLSYDRELLRAELNSGI